MAKTKPIGVRFDEDTRTMFPGMTYQKILNELTLFYKNGKSIPDEKDKKEPETPKEIPLEEGYIILKVPVKMENEDAISFALRKSKFKQDNAETLKRL